VGYFSAVCASPKAVEKGEAFQGILGQVRRDHEKIYVALQVELPSGHGAKEIDPGLP
jgi:hypothetical protein